MAQSLMLKPAGLYSYYNHLEAGITPTGGLLVASNCVIDRNEILSSRRGYQIYGNAMGGSSSDTARQLLNYKKRLLRHWGNTSTGNYLDWDDGVGNFSTFEFSLTATTHSNTVMDGITSTENVEVGMVVTGSGISANTTVASITNNNSLVLSQAASSGVTGSFTFTYNVEEVSPGTRIKGIEANGNYYFTSNNGIQKISVANDAGYPTALVTNSGGLAALDVSAILGTSGVGFLNPQSSCAYRIVFGITDVNNNEILGAPGTRLIVNNPGSNPQNVTLTATIPQGATTSNFYQVYRSPQITLVNSFTITGNTTNGLTTVSGLTDTSGLVVGMGITGTSIPINTIITSIPSIDTVVISNSATSAAASGIIFTVTQQLTGGSADPGDELQLAYEGNILNSDLNNGYVSVTDIAADTFLGAYLYTNQNSGQGILQSNYPPPLALDITSFKNYTFFSNTSNYQTLNLAMLSVSNLSSASSYIRISNGTTTNTYYFKTQTFTGNCSSTSMVVSSIGSTANLLAGQSVSCPNFPSGTYIVSITDANDIVLSAKANTDGLGVTFTAGYENASLNYIGISQFPTPGQQVNETTASMVRVINRNDAELIYVYTPNDTPTSVPGQMLLQTRNLNEVAFYVTVDSAATTGTQFNPALSTTQQTNATSTNQVNPNRLWYSKLQQPEAVPIINYFDIGPKDKAIIRILALRDNLFILKEEGIYRLTGTDPTSFTVFPFDYSTIIQASDSAVVLNNLIYLFSNQGIATISDTGVAIISRPIEGQIIPLLTSQYVDFSTATFGVSYETDRSYYLFTVTNPTDVYATQCFRYNTFTQTWTLLDLAKRSGLVNVNDNLLYLGATDVNYLEQERKNFDRTDYADRQYAITLATGCVAADGVTITLPSLTNVVPNDVVVQTQYLSLKQFNRILTKLENDSLLSPHNYVSSLTAGAGVNLSTSLDSLNTHLISDAGRTAVTGAINAANQVVTITNATPGVITNATNTTGYYNSMPVLFTTTGTLPTGLSPNIVYYVSSLGVDGAHKYRVSATQGGAEIATSSAGSGTHTAHPAYNALLGYGASSFAALQFTFNLMVGVLNNDTGVGSHNYQTSSGTVNYEFYIVATNTSVNTITSPFAYPLIAGPITVYEFIPVLLQFIPQSMGDVSVTKHVSEGTFIFEDACFTEAQIAYSTDLSGNFEGETIYGLGNGIFGTGMFGDGIFGGSGSGVPFRTYLPRNKQRARYVNISMGHNIAREIFYLYGISLTFSPMGQRGWRT